MTLMMLKLRIVEFWMNEGSFCEAPAQHDILRCFFGGAAFKA